MLQREPGSAIAYAVTWAPASLLPAFLRRAMRYGCVGFAISLLYSLAVIACVRLLQPISPTAASVIAFLITLPISYLAHGRISFSDRPYDTFQPLRFAVSTATSFVVAVGGMYWITDIAGGSYLLGIAWNWLIIPAVNFLAYMFWVFRAARNKGRAT
jgi:putative flippase GtrA